MDTVSFKVSCKDSELIEAIASRAMNHFKRVEPCHVKKIDVVMDLTAYQANGGKLNLAKFVAFDDFNLMHDVVGIMNNIDRSTGKVSRFLPRCHK